MELVGRLQSGTHGVRRGSHFATRFDRWRGLELTSARKRLQLVRSLEGVVCELRGPVRLPGASPLNRVGLRPYEQELSALAERLAALDRPVRERGVRLVHELVTDGGSPLYDRAAERGGPRRARPRPRHAGAALMYDLAGLAVASRLLRVRVRPDLGAGEDLMSSGDVIGLVISLGVLAYLVYALFRGENL